MTYLLLSILKRVESVQVLEKKIYNGIHSTIGGLTLQLNSENAIGHLSMFSNIDHEHFTIRIYGTKAALNINMLDLTITKERERNLPKVPARMLSTVEQSFQGISETTANIGSGAGLLYRNREELKEALKKMRERENLREELGERGKEYFNQNFTVEAHLDQYFSLIDFLKRRG